MRKLRADEIASTLRRRAASGEWGDDLRLPAERDLATELGVSRNTIRLALQQLEEAGALVRQVGRGTFLTSDESPTLAAIAKRMEGASPADVMETRLLIEPSAAANAATNASFSELQRVRDAHERALESKDVRTFEEWDAEFHRRIFACCGNGLLKDINDLIGIVRTQPLWFDMKARTFSEESLKRNCKEHSVILEHLLTRDPRGARNSMFDHLQSVKLSLLGR
ncbi:FCD domain-containing protein [Agrobacterium vitis]|uniref:FadR/GntR family transcriptional regulator n=1 Tax=Rhizobium/Agrobacterium group TaxID=227290 RepID=UPI0012E7A1F2|nr:MULTISPECIES: FCD domain-containing protein [Rhizobium/Agrobacterium group]MCF1494351.1 FadR family transcriptional regulator [Allorhizobium ampelinum]MVA45857.1 FCD domain-containing protein [Agrobacterium vitis]